MNTAVEKVSVVKGKTTTSEILGGVVTADQRNVQRREEEDRAKSNRSRVYTQDCHSGWNDQILAAACD